MTHERHQLNLKPEHYTIYIGIKEDKEKGCENNNCASTESLHTSNRCVVSHNWQPGSQIVHQCADLHLDDELLINKPGFIEIYGSGIGSGLNPSGLRLFDSLFSKSKKENSGKIGKNVAKR